MSFPRSTSLVLIAVSLLALLFASPSVSRADTYQFYNLGGSGQLSFYGLTDTGLAVFTANNLACPTTCYRSYLNGVFVSTSTIAPSLTFDNGTPCTPAAPGWSIFSGLCNNGYEVFSGTLGIDPPSRLWTVTGSTITDISPLVSPLAQFGAAPLSGLNSIGDIVFDDPFGENWWMAVDQNTLPTPEPSSLLLLATALGAAGLLLARRRATA